MWFLCSTFPDFSSRQLSLLMQTVGIIPLEIIFLVSLFIFVELLALGSLMLPSYPACSWPLIFMKCLWSHLLKKSLWRIFFNPRFIVSTWLFLQSCLPSSVGGCFQPEYFALLIVLPLILVPFFFFLYTSPYLYM